MNKGVMCMVLVLTLFLAARGVVCAAEEPQKPGEQPPAEQKPEEAKPEEPKPLAPGWLSLDSSVGLLDAKVDEYKDAIYKAIGINVSGFLDTGYQWTSAQPGRLYNHNITGRLFDMDYNTLVFNAFNITLDKPEKDWGVGFHISADFGRSAELLREATYYGSFENTPGDGEPSAELREAYITYTIPIGEGLQFKGGQWVTYLGTEILPNPGQYNENISRSYLFNFAIPIRHWGGTLTYPVLKTLSLYWGPVTGWDDPHAFNNTPSFVWGGNWNPADAFGLSSNFIYGPEQVNNGGPKRFTMSHVATIKPLDSLTLYAEYTYGVEQAVPITTSPPLRRLGTWQGFSTIASYNWTDRYTTALRGEVFHDTDGVRTATFHNLYLGEFTLTNAYKFTSKLIGRIEFRQDFANRGFFNSRNRASQTANQTGVGLQAIYTF